MDSLKIMKTKFVALLCFAFASMIILHLLVNDDKHLSLNESRPGVKRQSNKLFKRQSKTDHPSNKVEESIIVDNSGIKEDDIASLDRDLVAIHEPKELPTDDKDKELQHDIDEIDENKYADISQMQQRNRIPGKPHYKVTESTSYKIKQRPTMIMIRQSKRLKLYKTSRHRKTNLLSRLLQRDIEEIARPYKNEKQVNRRKRNHSRPSVRIQPLPTIFRAISQKSPKAKPSPSNKILNKTRTRQTALRKLSYRSGLKSRKSNKTLVTPEISNTTTLNFNCPYEGLGVQERTAKIYNVTCIPYPRTKEICNKAYDYMEPKESHPIQCDDHRPGDSPICVIKTLYRYDVNDKVQLKCNPDSCGDDILVGCIDKQYGILRNERHWQTFDSIVSLEANLPQIIKENSVNGFNFCFLKCGIDDQNNQPLIFPPIIKPRKTKKELAGLNVNILLEDAVSRSHFYRSLPHTVATLRQLAKNVKSGLKVFDFELMQSYAAFTLKNVVKLFNGNKKLEIKTGRENGINLMMKKFQKRGYQTLIQEDLCFFDRWGSILSENYNQKLQPFSRKFKAFFQKYWNTTSGYIDNRGLTSLACENLRSYGYTNPFSNPTKICLNGKFISNHMLKYVEDFLKGSDGHKDVAPTIIYTHLNTGHESSGERIRTDDVSLAEHIKAVSKLSNTITIILSDHGSKTTEYSISNFYGRLEVFSPMMFMIIPQKVAEILGKASVENLESNQKRLVALIDLHRMLNTISQTSRPAVNDHQVSGLLAPIPANRTCGEIEGLTSDAYCRCKGWNHFVSNSHQTTRWLAEVALGEINNRITQQYTKGRPKIKRTSLGYGACSRFTGQAIEQARQTFEGDNVITTLLFTVIPVYGSKSTERFQVRLNHSSVGNPNVRVINIIRVSVYGKYESCADKNVDIQLCACALGTTGENVKPQISLKDLLSEKHFGLKTSVRPLSISRCLLFGERTLEKKTIDKMQTRLAAFEITNKCSNKSFKLKITGKGRKTSISRKLPFNLKIFPRSVVFLFAVDNAWKYGRFKPLVKLIEESLVLENDEDGEANKQDVEDDFR